MQRWLCSLLGPIASAALIRVAGAFWVVAAVQVSSVLDLQLTLLQAFAHDTIMDCTRLFLPQSAATC